MFSYTYRWWKELLMALNLDNRRPLTRKWNLREAIDLAWDIHSLSSVFVSTRRTGQLFAGSRDSLDRSHGGLICGWPFSPAHLSKRSRILILQGRHWIHSPAGPACTVHSGSAVRASQLSLLLATADRCLHFLAAPDSWPPNLTLVFTMLRCRC